MPTFLNKIAPAYVVAALILPDLAVADHVPDGLSQDSDPNYIACLTAVDDAKPQFLDALQATCLTRMIEICRGAENEAPPSQGIDCISFETRRAIDFLLAAEAELPDAVEKTGLFWRSYQRRRDNIVKDVEAAKALAPPESIDAAVQQSMSVATAANLLFYLARETGTQLDALVATTFDQH
ncbi:MAG: hypothetical protein HC783_06670 [Rhodobacteraceae bacterium]|nr:hypothetical protein [Paracoccaceae bacterium]